MSRNAERVQEHRQRLRQSGLRPVQLWVKDTKHAGFAEECRRQSRLVGDDGGEKAMQLWLEQVADTGGWQ